MSPPETVIVVLNWNGREDTLDCLRSLARLEGGAYEILVVDNGSDDGSEDAIRAAYPQVHLLQTGSNLGFAGGNNAGIEWALKRGASYVLLLNNDTVVEPDFLHHMVESARQDASVGVVGASISITRSGSGPLAVAASISLQLGCGTSSARPILMNWSPGGVSTSTSLAARCC